MTEIEFRSLKVGMNVFRTYMQGPVICKVSGIENGVARIYEVVPVKNAFLGTLDINNSKRWFLTMVEALEDEIKSLDRQIEDRTLDDELRQKFIACRKRNEILLKRAIEKRQEKEKGNEKP